MNIKFNYYFIWICDKNNVEI